MTSKKSEDEVAQNADDVASLYSWANLHGTKYRDFSTARQEVRNQSRRRAAESSQAPEASAPDADAEAKPMAAAPDLTADLAPANGTAPFQPRGVVPGYPVSGPPGGVERRGAPRQVGSAPAGQLPPLYDRRVSRPSQAPRTAGSFVVDRHTSAEQAGDLDRRTRSADAPAASALPRATAAFAPESAAPPAIPTGLPFPGPPLTGAPSDGMKKAVASAPNSPTASSPVPRPLASPSSVSPAIVREEEFQVPTARPAWLVSEPESAVYGQAAGADTLQQSRERVASRWFALQGVFDGVHEPVVETPIVRSPVHIPTLAVFSLAGGVGKTSLVATLGRALAAHGERVLLADTTSYGLLPFYFGARELRPGVMRTFTLPGGAVDAPIHLLSVDAEGHRNDASEPDWLAAELTKNAAGANRILIDLATAAGSLTRRVLRMAPIVLVPVIPDMNSVVSLGAVDAFFRSQQSTDQPPIQPYYVLDQFDGSLPLHLDVREVLRQQLGDRLLPFVIRRSQAVSEALAEGMTVVDYAPNSPVAGDFANLSNWLRGVSMPASPSLRGIRWSEQ